MLLYNFNMNKDNSKEPKKLVATHLCKSYKDKKAVIDVSMSVSSGEIVGLLGPNGSGKTTSFYMIAGLVRQDSGTISINNIEISHMPMHKRSSCGLSYLPQENSIFKDLNVEDNIKAILQLTELSKQEQDLKLESLLEEFGISHIRKSMGISLSGGERRKVEIARALSTSPDFILLDEPFAGIDPVSVEKTQQVLKSLRSKSLGVLITDHSVRETLDICDRTYILIDGKTVISGTKEEIYANKTVRERYLGNNFA
jgi:lipopolysaccharide export system ATP-binding protein